MTAGGVHLLAIYSIGQYKTPVKLAMTSLHPAPLGLVAPFAARLPALAGQGQNAAIEGQLNGGGIDAGQVLSTTI